MKPDPAQRPIPSVERKAAIAGGRVFDHSGRVQIEPIKDFDLNRTIFSTLEGAAPRYVMSKRVAKEAVWPRDAAEEIEKQYLAARQAYPLPEVDVALLKFLADECDFDVEHADGSFLDHLYFCFEYGVQHYPGQSALVLLLHSVLGTGTNTFAMEADKIPRLRELLGDFDWKHVEAFPSVLRLLYDLPLRTELRANLSRADSLKSIALHRVIDNAPLKLDAEDLWIALNYQLVHLIDFLPVANWATHANDSAFIIFRDLYDLLQRAKKLDAKIDYTPANGDRRVVGERLGFGGWLVSRIPNDVSERMSAKTVRRFSEKIGHSLDYTIDWG